MTCNSNRAAYQQLVDEDLQWLLACPRTLERDHVEMIVRHSVDMYYRPVPDKVSPPQPKYRAWNSMYAAAEVLFNSSGSAGCVIDDGGTAWRVESLHRNLTAILGRDDRYGNHQRIVSFAEFALKYITTDKLPCGVRVD